MIRTILAVALTVALVATAVPAVRQGTGTAADEAVRSEVATLEAAATDLVETEEIPPDGVSGPRRAVSLSFPRSLEFLEIRRAGEASVVTYRLEGSSHATVSIAVPIVAADGGAVRIAGDVRVALELRNDRGAVVARPGV